MFQRADKPASYSSMSRSRSNRTIRFAWGTALAALVVISLNVTDLAGAFPTRPIVEREVCRFSHRGHVKHCDSESKIEMKRPDRGMYIYELNRFPDTEPTVEQREATDDLVAKSIASARAKGWLDFAQAKADGYQPMPGDHMHFGNLDFINDEHVLDPERPEYLMYSGHGDDRTLVSMMFVMNSPKDEGPQIGGPLTRWHFRYWAAPWCLNDEDRSILAPKPVDGVCPTGTPSHRSVEMLHVWLLPHPDGRFATKMHLKEEIVAMLVAERGF